MGRMPKMDYAVAGGEGAGAGDMRCGPWLRGPERLVGLGFRFWMLGCGQGDIRHWERAWSLYSGVFGVVGAQAAVGALAGWVGAVSSSAHRSIGVETEACGSFCRDERLAIAMISACQHGACPAMRACAFALLSSSAVDAVLDRAQAFAGTLASLDQILEREARPQAVLGLDTRGLRPS